MQAGAREQRSARGLVPAPGSDTLRWDNPGESPRQGWGCPGCGDSPGLVQEGPNCRLGWLGSCTIAFLSLLQSPRSCRTLLLIHLNSLFLTCRDAAMETRPLPGWEQSPPPHALHTSDPHTALCTRTLTPRPPKIHPTGAGGPGSRSSPAEFCLHKALARRQERVLFSPCRQPERWLRFPGIRIQGCREEAALIIANYCSRADSTRVSSAAPSPPPAPLRLPTDPRQPRTLPVLAPWGCSIVSRGLD